MLAGIVTFILVGVAWFFGKSIRKHFVLTTSVFIVIALLATVFNEIPPLKPFYQGMIGLAFIYVVLVTGAIPQQTKLRIKLNGVRKEFSIYGVILVSPHAFKYLIQWLQGIETFEWWGVLSFVIMLPLFVTSFYVIRRKMTPQTWKTVQSAAYLTYALLFIHLILRYTETINLVIYSLMIITYVAMKTYTECTKCRHQKTRTKDSQPH